jgi:hypothetical protein
MKRRRRITHAAPLEQRLMAEAQRLRDQARQLPPGSDRAALLRKARQAEAACEINEVLTGPQR